MSKILILFSCIFLSCHYKSNSNYTVIKDDRFKIIDTFHYFKHLETDLYNIEAIKCNKDIIIVFANNSDNLVKIFNYDFDLLYSFGSKGKGHNEFIMPYLASVEDSLMSIVDLGRKTIQEFDYKGENSKSIKLDNLYQQCKKYDDSNYILEYKTHSHIGFHSTDDLKKEVFRFSDLEKEYNDSNAYFGFMETSIKHGTIVYASQYLRNIYIFNTDGTLKRSLAIHPQNLPIIKNDHKVDNLNSTVYYCGIQALDDSFIVYNVGKTNNSLMKNLKQETHFEEYDYEGKPIRKIIIDRYIQCFCIINDKIYGYDIENENSLVVFQQRVVK